MAGTAKAATKAVKAANPRRTTKAAGARVLDSRTVEGTARPTPAVPVVDERDLPPELRDMYGPPKLTTGRGAGTTTEADDTDFDFDTSAPVAEVPMERLFSIDGVPYYIPVEFPPAYAIVFLDALSSGAGEHVAVSRILKLAIGQGWDALVRLAEQRPDLINPAQFSALMEKVMRKAMGAVDVMEGNG